MSLILWVKPTWALSHIFNSHWFPCSHPSPSTRVCLRSSAPCPQPPLNWSLTALFVPTPQDELIWKHTKNPRFISKTFIFSHFKFFHVFVLLSVLKNDCLKSLWGSEKDGIKQPESKLTLTLQLMWNKMSNVFPLWDFSASQVRIASAVRVTYKSKNPQGLMLRTNK